MAELRIDARLKRIAKQVCTYRTSASTLIENMVALMILSIIMALSLELVLQLHESNSFGIKTQARHGLEVYADSSIDHSLSEPGTWRQGFVHYTRNTETCKLNGKLTILHFYAFNEADSILFEERVIIKTRINEKN